MADSYFHVSRQTGYLDEVPVPGVAVLWDETEGWVYATTESVHPPSTFTPLRLPGVLKLGTTPITASNSAGYLLLAALAQTGAVANQVITWTGATWEPATVMAAGGAPIGAQYVTLALNGDLTAERVLTGTANQVILTDGGANGNITLSLPQDIHTGASPQFTGLNLSGLTASRLLATDGSKNLASVADLTSWIAGTANRVTISSDGDGTATLTGPQDIHTGASPTFEGLTLGAPTQDYTYGGRLGFLTLQSQTAGQRQRLELYTKDGDATDSVGVTLFGRGTPGAVTDFEHIRMEWDASNTRYEIATLKGGSGTARPLHIYTEANTTQLVLNTDGSVDIATDLDVGDDLTVSGDIILTGDLLSSVNSNILVRLSDITYGMIFAGLGSISMMLDVTNTLTTSAFRVYSNNSSSTILFAVTELGAASFISETTLGQQLVTLDQNDTDQAFFDFQGNTGANATASISTRTVATVNGFVQVEINGTKKWLAYYNDPTS